MGYSRASKNVAMGKNQDGTKKMPKLGTGERFKMLEGKLENKKTKSGKQAIKNPAALAASIGRKKFGKKKFQAMAAKGKRQA